MCTVYVSKSTNINHLWPVYIAANRDENPNRPWLAPGRHWSDHPHIIAGQDLGSPEKGSWLGLNDNGVAAILVNRENTQGSMPGKKSRGRLVLKCLNEMSADSAMSLIRNELSLSQYRGFYLVISDIQSTYILEHDETNTPICHTLDQGEYRISPHGITQTQSSGHNKSEHIKWDEWIDKLAQARVMDNSYSVTLSSSLLALGDENNNYFLFSETGPDHENFKPVVTN